MRLQDIISAVQEYHPSPDLEIIRKAYAFVRVHHEGQTRASGEPYITHVTHVAFLATNLKLDVASVVTALLHDTVEDTDVTLKDIQREFGDDVAQLVDGVTKLSRVNFSSRAEEQAENFRKMLLAMARDIRVLLIKLCDRTHNMQTLEFLSESRRLRIAQETLDIYAPLAHRLGIYWMKSELEDLALRYLKPEAYEAIKASVNQKKVERERYIAEVVAFIKRELDQNEIQGVVAGRPKHFYSIFQKMEKQGLCFDEIYDLIAFRLIVPTTMDCYAALGAVHAAWKPIPGRFKDYIAMPKPNGYQSLHTTVIGPGATRIEIQIRTPDMHAVAESGIAAHWVYKEDKTGAAKLMPKDGGLQFSWLKDLVESGNVLRDPHEFMSTVKDDLFSQEVFVFSPKGDVIALSTGATPIDFAYHIHSEVGHHCIGARVNGQQVSLAYRLRNGDAVEILTSPRQMPNKDWLNLVTTSKAKQRIRQWLKTEERNKSIAIGKELLQRDCGKLKVNFSKVVKGGAMQQIAQDMGLGDVDSLFAEIGYGKLSPSLVLGKIVPDETDLDSKLSQDETTLQKIFQKAARALKDKSGVTVNGMEDMVFRFARCCEPLPGEPIVGYITRGRGVVVHKQGCSQTLSFDPQRFVPVSWEAGTQAERSIKISVLTLDKVGLLAMMSQSIASGGANIVSAQIASTHDGKSVSTFEISIGSNQQLEDITRALERVDGVIRVERKRPPQQDDS